MIRFLLLIFVLVVFSCKEKSQPVSVDENNGDPVFRYTSADEEMNNAIKKAQATYDEFLKALEKPDSLMEDFAVKMRFEYDEDNGEHMWLNDLYLKNEKLYGTLASDPVEIKTVKPGDTLEVIVNKLSDWMYLRQNKLVGGYTIRTIYNKMSKEEKEQFNKEMGYEIE